MSYKQYTDTSQQPQQVTSSGGGAYTAQDHSWDQIVVNADKPLVDWELNVAGEINSLALQRFISSTIPSSFTDMDADDYIMYAASVGNENKFQLLARNVVMNGKLIRFAYSGSTTETNVIELPAAPASGTRYDLVVLEMWIVEIKPQTVSSDYKSPTGKIFRLGNVKTDDTINLTDDILDPTIATQTTNRVQIQYRYRVVTDIDIETYQNGIDDGTHMTVNTVSYYGGSGIDGSTVAGYLYSEHPTDNGLWMAGSNDAMGVNDIGSLDGMMYAMPICVVSRRNITAWDKSTNTNGAGAIITGISGRPDGKYYDIVYEDDIIDLRKRFIQDYKSELQSSEKKLFDNALLTRPRRENIQRDTINSSTTMAMVDGIRTTFSDRRVSIPASVSDSITATDTYTVSLLSLQVTYYGSPINLMAMYPNCSISHISKIYIADSGTSQFYDALDTTETICVNNIIYSKSGGTVIDTADIMFTSSFTGSIIVEVVINYDKHEGLSETIDSVKEFAVPASVYGLAWLDTSTLSTASDATMYKIDSPAVTSDMLHREINVKLTTSIISGSYQTGTTGDYIVLPYEVTGNVHIDDGAGHIYDTTSYTTNGQVTRVSLSYAITAYNSVTADFVALRPLPQVSGADYYEVYYKSVPIQTLIPNTSDVVKLKVLSTGDMHVITTGSASPDSGFPYEAPGNQIPIPVSSPSTLDEYKLDSSNYVSVVGFGSNTGYAKLSTMIPYASDELHAFSAPADVINDNDNRYFWPKIDVPGYSPKVYTYNLEYEKTHKTVYPMLVKLIEDSHLVGRAGEVLLMMLVGWHDYDGQNSVEVTDSISSSGIAIYRLNLVA